jgi:hypothetical protein
MGYYSKADKEDRYAQLSSRNNVIGKSFVTDLWTKVLHRAIDDIVMYTIMRENNTELKQEDLELEESAHSLLFNDDHRIRMDDYKIIITCCSCKKNHMKYMSQFSQYVCSCPHCDYVLSNKETKYKYLEGQIIKEMSLAELLSMWNINNIERFRVGVRKRIKELIVRKKKAAENRRLAKLKRKKNMTKKEKTNNFEAPSDSELTEFDKGIIKILDDTRDLLMAKNRKYGNSATNPVRAFSKSSAQEQIKVRIDDKISRLVRSKSDQEDEDVVQDLTGYLVILAALQKGYIK